MQPRFFATFNFSYLSSAPKDLYLSLENNNPLYLEQILLAQGSIKWHVCFKFWNSLFSWGRSHKSWAHGANHRDSSIHLRPMPMPNFWETFNWHKCSAQGVKDWGRAQHSFWNWPLVNFQTLVRSNIYLIGLIIY